MVDLRGVIIYCKNKKQSDNAQALLFKNNCVWRGGESYIKLNECTIHLYKYRGFGGATYFMTYRNVAHINHSKNIITYETLLNILSDNNLGDVELKW